MCCHSYFILLYCCNLLHQFLYVANHAILTFPLWDSIVLYIIYDIYSTKHPLVRLERWKWTKPVWPLLSFWTGTELLQFCSHSSSNSSFHLSSFPLVPSSNQEIIAYSFYIVQLVLWFFVIIKIVMFLFQVFYIWAIYQHLFASQFFFLTRFEGFRLFHSFCSY